ncbi:MAG: phytanoyl-CoA dioxygenase family protein [Planctomycetes bacterium]|nr:phytanoyl-CoA dioxygenase family protein [Planctomycetota bacterium]MCH9725822.1 phytanoyl-CoA dioxygenase family protein [Planctomycetota bacterium]MCH9777376.1 phytanoyl-CoA dioxygenase family protein [Planctomycetota bacterium]MCH9792403.1 phytanoyl-CoA dioxygenase family protein [Planctomycetota bacterium]MDF1746202.1 phytanoyl-CoA dioxygenase family protein [Gimesia sp.]
MLPLNQLCTLNCKSEDIELSKQHLHQYEEEGVLLVKNLFDPQDYLPMRNDLAGRLSLLEQHYGADISENGNEITQISDRLIRLEELAPGSQSILYDSMNSAPSLHTMGAHPKLITILETLLSPDISIHDRYIILMSMPQGEWHLASWHQDWYYNEGPYSTITMYAPLQKTDHKNGSLTFALGEHQKPPVTHDEHDHGITTKWHSLPPEVVHSYDRVVPTSLEVGDVLLFHSLTPHTPSKNQSNYVRFVLNLRYRDLRDPQFLEEGWRIKDITRARQAMQRSAS